MSFGSLGWTEIVLVLIVALVIFGPGKLPEIGKAMGKTIREFKMAVNKIDTDIKKEVDDIKDSVGVEDLKATINPVNIVKEAVVVDMPAESIAPDVAAKTTENMVNEPSAVNGAAKPTA